MSSGWLTTEWARPFFRPALAAVQNQLLLLLLLHKGKGRNTAGIV